MFELDPIDDEHAPRTKRLASQEHVAARVRAQDIFRPDACHGKKPGMSCGPGRVCNDVLNCVARSG